MKFVVPQSAPYYPRSKNEPGYQDGMISHLVPFAVTEPGILNGLFLSSCRSLATLSNNDSYLREAFKYNVKCIQLINEAISKEGVEVTDATITKVLLLSSAEVSTSLFYTSKLNRDLSDDGLVPCRKS